MKLPSIKAMSGIFFGIGIAVIYLGSILTDYAQGVALSFGTTLLGFGIALFVVNGLLDSSDKRLAAFPLLKMMARSVSHYHNNLFIENCRLAFGKEEFSKLIDTYQKHKNDPKAFSPEQRDRLYGIITDNEDELKQTVEKLGRELEEVSNIIGWSFNPKIMRDCLEVRLNSREFCDMDFDSDVNTKLRACELYLDMEADATAILNRLAGYIGLSQDEYMGEG